jgi:arylsulfatase A-like enzyme
MKSARFFPHIVLMMFCMVLFGCGSTIAFNKDMQQRKVILFVWDGLRPDSVTQTTTPNLWELSRNGVFFEHNHSTYPTFTMMNSSSFNTGDYPGKAGFYGNTFWLGPNKLQSKNASSGAVDYKQPVFTEDWNILTSLNSYYNGQLFLVTRLLDAAQAKGLKTCIVGKSGAAFMFDLTRRGYGIDENMVFPQSLASELQNNGYPLPKNTPVMWPGITLAANNGAPTAFGAKSLLTDGVTSDPTLGTTSLFYGANQYMLNTYMNYILPVKDPAISVIWFRDPDSTEHGYGPGSAAYKDALGKMDSMLGQLRAQLKKLGINGTTDIIVVSDHGHNSVAGDASLFPLRGIQNGGVVTNGTDPINGYSVSGDVRLAQLLADNGIATHVYDGSGCIKDPVMSGLLADGKQVYPTQIDTDGKVCSKGAGYQYTTRSFVVPATLPDDAVVISANGGSDYLYVPAKNIKTVENIVRFLQSREEFGAIFVDYNYGNISGAFKMSAVHLENTAGRNPDIIVSYNFDKDAAVQGLQGTEYESMQGNRGMHGSFSPVDVHNTLIAFGPDFKSGMKDEFPSGNIDVAPTIAHLLGLPLPDTDGRVLYEAIKDSKDNWIKQWHDVLKSEPVKDMTFYKPTAIKSTDAITDSNKFTYKAILVTSSVKDADGKEVTYFDFADVERQ